MLVNEQEAGFERTGRVVNSSLMLPHVDNSSAQWKSLNHYTTSSHTSLLVFGAKMVARIVWRTASEIQGNF
jgi:hypothetical protein